MVDSSVGLRFLIFLKFCNFYLIVSLKIQNIQMKHLFLLLSILLISVGSKAQICNFCSENNLKETLKEQHAQFHEQLNIRGEKCLTIKEENYMKCWHFRYDQCYMYDITILKKKYVHFFEKVLTSQYTKTSFNTWEDSENKVEMNIRDGCYQFIFVPKISLTQNVKEK